VKTGGRAFIKLEVEGVNIKGGHALVGSWIPDPNSLIIGRRCESTSIWRPGNQRDPATMPLELRRALAGGRIPDPNGVVIRR
jgi:hypothetical protein